ncbi:methyl-accepting chemotaxis protein [Rhodobacter viridis]|nr:methyl-accepting chemotaxis protein [Rhodobacter viridis]
MKNPLTTVSGKMGLAAGLMISLILLCATAYDGWRTAQKVNDDVMGTATDKARAAASEVSEQIVEARAAASGLSGMLSGYLKTGSAKTADIVTMLEAVPNQYKSLFSSWMAGLPDGSTDALITGTDGRNEAGVFTPYWTKQEGGGLLFQTFPIMPDQTWYSVPVTQGKPVTTEPYLTTEGYLVTSVAVPIRLDDKIVGIAGVDITLAEMTATLSGMETFEGSHMMLVDGGGKWIVNPDPKRLTQTYDEIGAADLQAALKDGKPRLITGLADGARRLVYPFKTAGMEQNWATVLDLPEAVFVAPVRHETLISIVKGGLILALALAAIFAVSTLVVRRPLACMLDGVDGLAAGHYDTAVSGAERRDEMGAMARSVETLRLGLIDKRRLEAEQARLRAEAEQERLWREADEARLREEREERQLADLERERLAALAEEEARRREEAERAARAAEQAEVVDHLAAGLRGLASGQLDVEIGARFAGDYDQLRLDFNETVARLADLIASIDATTQGIVSGVREITGATTDLSRQTETTAATLEETAAALNEITASVQTAAQGARQVNDVMRTATGRAQATNEVVAQTIAAMQAIQESSSQISKITNVIDDIAFQTNLLALNAGVEAARAGEAGRGFAVVASEVRALAQRASEAAREINGFIADSGRQVDVGADLVARAGEALQAIIAAISTISGHITEIASSAEEQASGIAEINTAIHQLDRTQQHNAAGFEETAAACMTLNDQALTLEQLLGQFQLKTGGSQVSAARAA